MARGQRTTFDPMDHVDIFCNHCPRTFKGRTDFVNRMLKKHLMITHNFTEQQAKIELSQYSEVNYTIRSGRRNYQTNVNATDSDYIFELEIRSLMRN